MQTGPDMFDSSEDEGMSDDPDYIEFKNKIKATQQNAYNVQSEADREKEHLKTVFTKILFGKDESVLEQFDKGLDIEVDLDNRWTPLLLSATTGYEKIFSGLLQRGANVDQTRDGGTTSLIYLCSITSNDEDSETSILNCVKLLLDKNVNVNAIDNKRRTAIMAAAYHGHYETVKILLPLVDKEALDNQGWNVLFWAVDGNHPPIVRFLLSEYSFDCSKTDVRGTTVAELAYSNGSEEILELFPQDPLDEFYDYLHVQQYNFEETFNSLKKNQKPQFFNDICKILYGTKSEYVMPVLRENNVKLEDFLAISDTKLQQLGINFPYQRARILNGLYRFHKRPFKPQSIPFIKKEQLYINIDISTSVLTCLKQLIAMESSLRFILENNPQILNLPESKEAKILISKTRQLIQRLTVVTDNLEKKTEQWDLEVRPADRITKLRRNIPWANLCLAVGVLSIFVIYKFH